MRRIDCWLTVLLITVLFSVLGCRGDDDECAEDEHEDLSGMWQLDMVLTSYCDPEDIGEEDTETVTVTQSGSTIVVDVGGFFLVSEVTGSICGDTFHARGTASDEFMGCSGSETVTVSGTVEGDTVQGQVSFSQHINDPEVCLGIESCNGSYDFMGERVDW